MNKFIRTGGAFDAVVDFDAATRDAANPKRYSATAIQEPATNYYQNERDVLKLSENTAQVFLGMRIQCAQCHNHPFDRWTQDDYYGFAAFFSQVGRKGTDDYRETIVFNGGGGEVTHPVRGVVMKPKFSAGPAGHGRQGPAGRDGGLAGVAGKPLLRRQPCQPRLGPLLRRRHRQPGGRRARQQPGVEPGTAARPALAPNAKPCVAARVVV